LTDRTTFGRGATAGGCVAKPGVVDHQLNTLAGSTERAVVEAEYAPNVSQTSSVTL
jgi:hypothetical protein